jgi:hypothetical protein
VSGETDAGLSLFAVPLTTNEESDMRFRFKTKAVAAATFLVRPSGATAASGYLTTDGTGGGAPSIGTNTAVTLARIGSVTVLTSGSTPQPVDCRIANPVCTNQFLKKRTEGAPISAAPRRGV